MATQNYETPRWLRVVTLANLALIGTLLFFTIPGAVQEWKGARAFVLDHGLLVILFVGALPHVIPRRPKWVEAVLSILFITLMTGWLCLRWLS